MNLNLTNQEKQYIGSFWGFVFKNIFGYRNQNEGVTINITEGCTMRQIYAFAGQNGNPAEEEFRYVSGGRFDYVREHRCVPCGERRKARRQSQGQHTVL